MKLLIFVLIVFVANMVSVSGAKFSCYNCADCPLIASLPSSGDDCEKCQTTIDKSTKKVDRKCIKAGETCTQDLTASPVVKCCDTKNCNNDEPFLTPKTISCYECTECANPFQKDAGSVKKECAACKTTTTKADKKINKECILTVGGCSNTNDEKTSVECCTTDLCNAGISHSIKKSVLVGLLALAIGAICY